MEIKKNIEEMIIFRLEDKGFYIQGGNKEFNVTLLRKIIETMDYRCIKYDIKQQIKAQTLKTNSKTFVFGKCYISLLLVFEGIRLWGTYQYEAVELNEYNSIEDIYQDLEYEILFQVIVDWILNWLKWDNKKFWRHLWLES